ncbi:MAG: 2-C-methyl-D-erythritol 4-phosphate cytidylyltransferase [Acidobacteriaceae bacterium]
MQVYVIIPAAGLGTRMGAAPHSAPNAAPGMAPAPKQFLELLGVPILIHTLRAFLSVPAVQHVFVAVRPNETGRVRAQVHEYALDDRTTTVAGGETRQGSVGNALRALQAGDDDIVLVHDAVRPLIDRATIERTIEAVAKHGAAIVGVPAIDTIKQVERTADGALISTTIPRERIMLAQTPQGFRCGLLRRIFREAEADGFLGTDEASLAERAGVPVAVVMGAAHNFKITQPGDLELAEFYLQHSGH